MTKVLDLLVRLARTDFAATLLEQLAEKIGVPVEVVTAFVDWLATLSHNQRLAVAAAMSPGFGIGADADSLAGYGCDVDNCPDGCQDVLDGLRENAQVVEQLAAIAG